MKQTSLASSPPPDSPDFTSSHMVGEHRARFWVPSHFECWSDVVKETESSLLDFFFSNLSSWTLTKGDSADFIASLWVRVCFLVNGTFWGRWHVFNCKLRAFYMDLKFGSSFFFPYKPAITSSRNVFLFFYLAYALRAKLHPWRDHVAKSQKQTHTRRVLRLL